MKLIVLVHDFWLSFNGGYRGHIDMSSRYAVYSGIGVFAIKKTELEDFGFGIAYSNNFKTRKTQVLPFLFWDKSFTSIWGVESTIPTFIFGRVNVSPSTIFLVGMNYNSESYSIDVEEGSIAILSLLITVKFFLSADMNNRLSHGYRWKPKRVF